MYKLLLCRRYLRTRYLAFVCIVSVMLGVATLIVVNSVMSGFSTKLKERLRGLLADVVLESRSLQGFPIPADEILRRIEQSPAHAHIAAVSPTLEVFALMSYKVGNEPITQVVRVVGVEPKSRTQVGGFAEYLCDPNRRISPHFDLDLEGLARYEQNHPRTPPKPKPQPQEPLEPGQPPLLAPTPDSPTWVPPNGIVIGYSIATRRAKGAKAGAEQKDITVLPIGADLFLTTFDPQTQNAIQLHGAVCDYFKSELNDYDANSVYVPLDFLRHRLSWDNRATAVQIKLKDYRHAREVVDALQQEFPSSWFSVQTWEDKQGPLLAAIAVERGILNVLLFLIVGVAGFGILAIFSMIVMEKTKDIGILKALGASNTGVMVIFLGYGLLLGVVGAALGTVLGLVITEYINDIEQALAKLTGQDVFPRDVYYFDKIPTNVSIPSVIFINLGAVLIATAFSVLPAVRAAMLHPVRALRYE